MCGCPPPPHPSKIPFFDLRAFVSRDRFCAALWDSFEYGIREGILPMRCNLVSFMFTLLIHTYGPYRTEEARELLGIYTSGSVYIWGGMGCLGLYTSHMDCLCAPFPAGRESNSNFRFRSSECPDVLAGGRVGGFLQRIPMHHCHQGWDAPYTLPVCCNTRDIFTHYPPWYSRRCRFRIICESTHFLELPMNCGWPVQGILPWVLFGTVGDVSSHGGT